MLKFKTMYAVNCVGFEFDPYSMVCHIIEWIRDENFFATVDRKLYKKQYLRFRERPSWLRVETSDSKLKIRTQRFLPRAKKSHS